MSGVTLKLAGVAQQTICVPSLDALVVDLRQSIAQSIGLDDPSRLKLIVGGRRLVDNAKSLTEAGVTPSSSILVLGGQSAAAQAQLAGQEDAAAARDAREQRLQRLRAAAASLAKRSGDSGIGTEEHYDLTLENQAGEAVVLDRGDREALVMGLSLADKGHRTLEQASGAYKDALEELLLAEQAFDSCNASILDTIDNIALLKLDIVWCYFQMRDAGSLGAAQARLATARAGLARAHGPNLERLKVLHGNFSPELATYVRLELLEGIAAFYAGDGHAARARLEASRTKWERLQVSDDRLAALLAMGFASREATRALRFCQGDVEASVAFVMEQRAAQQQREARRKEERALRREQARLGRTAQGAKVDMHLLERLCLLGYERTLAAEALRQANNDANGALDLLSNELSNAALQQQLAAQAHQKRARASVDEADVAALVSMGFSEAAARAALEQAAAGNAPDLVQAAMERMLSGSSDTGGASSSAQGAAVPAPEQQEQEQQPQQQEERDEEMEGELTAAVHKDPLSAYDVDVADEGAAIQEYLALLQDGT